MFVKVKVSLGLRKNWSATSALSPQLKPLLGFLGVSVMKNLPAIQEMRQEPWV